MRLGTRLMMAFLAVAFIPAGAVMTFTWFIVEAHFQDEFRSRLDGVTEGLSSHLEGLGGSLEKKVTELRESEGVEQILIQMIRGTLDRSKLIPVAGRWLKTWDLDLLQILDSSGTVLSSGHLPARYGTRDEALMRLSVSRPMAPTICSVQVSRDGKIDDFLAVVVIGRRKFGDAEVIIAGGKLLDEQFVSELGSLSGAKIQLVDENDRILVGNQQQPQMTAGEKWQDHGAVVFRRIPLPSNQTDSVSAFVLAGVSKAELQGAQQRILLVSAAAAVAGFFFSWLFGVLLSRKILASIHALVAGARRIARGNLQHRVPESDAGEIGALVRTFNQMVEDLSVSRRKLVQAERVAAWQEIARRIAHEIKNPLSPIQMSIETLRKTYDADHPEFPEIFEESTLAILEEVAALKRIVSEFSDFARLPKPNKIEQDLNLLVESTLSLYRSQEEESRLRFDSGAVPAVAFDREQISRVLTNLLSNAFWAIAEDGTVQVRTYRSAAGVVLEVRDDGRGMSAEVLAKVFTPYYTTRNDGTGLGLAIVQRIVEDHDGSVEIQSAENEGTLVSICIPLTDEARA